MAPDSPTRVAVLGGGIAALAAAMELTATEDLRRQHEVTVYTMGWRLGGKGASSRNPAHANRIEEHGLHLWAGWYHNAFRMIRDAYDELGRDEDHPLPRWGDAFEPHDRITLMEELGGEWQPWTVTLGRAEGLPGDEVELIEPWEYVLLLLPWMAHFARAQGFQTPPVRPALALPDWLVALGEGLEDALDGVARWLGIVRDPLERETDPEPALGALEAWMARIERQVDEALDERPELRRAAIILDLARTYVVGMVRDGVLSRGFEAIDHLDYRDWLASHGCRSWTLDSAAVRCVYDYFFGYRDGDPEQPTIAAGAALRMVLRLLLSYRGSLFFRMTVGMGEAVFTPLYQVLRVRGVRFAFFHQVEDLEVVGDALERVHVKVQAEADGYLPLVDLDGLEVWPPEPLWHQLSSRRRGDLEAPWGPGRKRVLERGRDFDQVVVGLPPEVLRPMAPAAWREALDASPTCSTLSAQLWFARGRGRSPQGETVQTAYAQPYATWADLSHLLPKEGWRPPLDRLAYLTGVFRDGGPAAATTDVRRGDAQVAEQLNAWLAEHGRGIWPELEERDVRHRYVRANTRPSERYVLTPPGAPQARLRAGETGLDNAVLCGDWVRTGIDLGCIESAVMSGRQASRALCGSPEHVPGERDLRP